MNFTGERPTPEEGVDGSRIRYKSIIPFCLNKSVLDFGCGIGHGTYFLSKFVKQVFGYDHSSESIEDAIRYFPQIAFTSNLKVIDFSKISIISMVEVIEHFEKNDVETLLQNFSKLHKEMIVTTPNGDWFPYHPKTLQERTGFHTWHYTNVELKELFGRYFSFVEIYGNAFDESLGKFTGYLVYASNNEWKDSWITDIEMK